LPFPYKLYLVLEEWAPEAIGGTMATTALATKSRRRATPAERLASAAREAARLGGEAAEAAALADARETRTAATQIATAAGDPGLTDMDDRQVTCMTEGHDWPRHRLGRIIPKGIYYYPNADGTKQRVDTCKCCGTKRMRTTLVGGARDRTQQYDYEHPEWWIHFHEADEMTRGRIADEHSWRGRDAIDLATVG
jgi:hypothetical protein